MRPIPKRTLIPVVTDLIEYVQATHDTISYAQKIVEKYGDVCDVSYTGVKTYFIHDPAVIKEMLTTQAEKFKRGYVSKIFRKFFGYGLFTADGDFHKKRRHLIKPAFYPQRIPEYANIMVKCAEEEINTWKAGETININEAMTRITMKVIIKTLFGPHMEQEAADNVSKKLSAGFDALNEILRNPAYIYCLEEEIDIPIIKRFFTLRSELDSLISDIISSCRKEADPTRTDILTMLMYATDEKTQDGLTDEEIRTELKTFLIAGLETTTLALTWTWYLLGKHPEIEKQFYEEVNNTISDRLPEAYDYHSLHLTKNIFKESMRLYPPAWTIAREATEDVDIQDYHFPEGSVLCTITYLVHHNEKYFHDPEEFIPSRWDDEKIKELPKYAYFPFGGGNMMCLGEGFALMEGILILATIASRYRLKFEKDLTTGMLPVFTLKTKDPVLMKVEKL